MYFDGDLAVFLLLSPMRESLPESYSKVSPSVLPIFNYSTGGTAL